MKRFWQLILIAFLGLSLSLGLGRSVLSENVAPENTISGNRARRTLIEAQKLYQQNDFQAALQLLKQAKQEFTQTNKPLQQAQTQALISFNYQKLENWQQAQAAIDEGIAITASQADGVGKQKVSAQLWNAQGSLDLKSNNNEQALTSWSKAQEFYQSVNDELGLKGIAISRSQALENLGFYRRSCKTLLGVVEQQSEQTSDCQNLTDQQIDKLLKSTATNAQISSNAQLINIKVASSLANNLMLLGQLEYAQKIIEHNQQIARQANQFPPALRTKIDFTAAHIAQSRANLAKARDDQQLFQQEKSKAEGIYQNLKKADSSEPVDILEAQINLIDIYARDQQQEEARSLLQTANLNFTDLPINYRTIKNQILLAQSLTSIKEQGAGLDYSWQDIDSIYQKLQQQAHQLKDDRLESYALGYSAELAYEHNLGNSNQAQTRLEQALSLAQSKQIPEIAYRWQWQLGRLYRDRSDNPKAIAAYESAFQTLQTLRSDLVALDREVQFSFRQQVEPVYRQYAQLLLTEQEPKEINNPNNLRKVREIIEALQLAELDNYFQDACVAAEERKIEEIDPHAAVIYTITLPAKALNPKSKSSNQNKAQDRLEVILSLPNDEFVLQEVIIPRSQLSTTIEELNYYLLQPDQQKDTERLANQVYNWLISPLKPALDNSPNKINTLVFVLDGQLQSLPMSALYDGQKYLLEDYAIAVTPGLRLLKAQAKRERLVALAGGVSEQIGDFAPLNNVKNELDYLQSNFKGQTLLNDQFTNENLIAKIAADSYSIVHLATHGQFSSNPDETFIVLWDRKLSIKEFSNLILTHNLERSQIIDLLVLSACETAQGDNRATLGLAGMSVRTGVSSTLATLWQIPDQSTAVLMEKFYSYLLDKPELNKAEALRLAQLDLRKAETNWSIPLFWAPYVIIGNWI